MNHLADFTHLHSKQLLDGKINQNFTDIVTGQNSQIPSQTDWNEQERHHFQNCCCYYYYYYCFLLLFYFIFYFFYQLCVELILKNQFAYRDSFSFLILLCCGPLWPSSSFPSHDMNGNEGKHFHVYNNHPSPHVHSTIGLVM